MPFKLYSFVLLGVTTLLFYTLRKSLRPYVLLTVSLVFIARLDFNAAVWVVAFSTIVYFLGVAEGYFIGKNKKKPAHIIEVAGIVLILFSLIILKYSVRLSLSDSVLQKIILPLGFSYYAFQGISYVVDIYKEKQKPEYNPFYVILYMCFFPKFVSGPIEKPEKLLGQIRNLKEVRLFENNRLSVVFPTLLYGFFMKVVVADRLAIYTVKLFEATESFSSLWLFAGMIMYTFQIYCDFAGYSAIAIGVGRLFGIELSENFFSPYLSENIVVFWRRWHISLSTWLKDYLYIPLGGNRKGNVRKSLNVMIVFLVCGMWHGAGINFVIWGLLHGLYQVIYLTLSKKNSFRFPQKIHDVLSIVVTFLLVAFAWVFFGATSAKSAILYVLRMLTFRSGELSFEGQMLNLGFTVIDRCIPAYAVIVLAMDFFCLRSERPFGEAIQKIPAIARYFIEYALIIAILLLGVYGPGYNPNDFMYMEF